MMTTETFAVTNAKLIDQVADLFEMNGVTYTADDLKSYFKSKDSILVASSIDDRLVGAGCATKLGLPTANEVAGWKYPDEAKIIDGYYGMLLGSAIHPEYMGQGIGRALTQERLRYLIAADCWEVLAVTKEPLPEQELGFNQVEIRAADGRALIAMAVG